MHTGILYASVAEPEPVDFSKIYKENGQNWTRGAGINILTK
jgi:hypothetical protein